MPPVGPIVMFPPPTLVFTVAEKEADGVGAAVDPGVDPGAAGAVPGPAAGEAEDDAAAADAAAPEDRAGSVCCLRADEVRLDEQPTTATAAKTAQAAAILTLVGRAMS